MSALLARVRGAGFVAIAARGGGTPLQSARKAAAEKAGFDMVLTGGSTELKEKIHARFPGGVDRVIVSSPPASLGDAIALIRFGGIITFYGLHMGGANVIPVDVNDLIFRKISLIPTFAEPAVNFPVSISLLRGGRIDPALIITHTFSFDSARDVLAGMVDGTLPAVKPILVL